MAACEPIRPSLYRIIDGEADPAEAMRVARHVSACTACRILLARKRRLAEMLEHDLEDLPADEEFVRTVMSTLPEGPPPRRHRLRRGLKLAGLAGLLGWIGQAAARNLQFGAPEAPTFALPHLDLGVADGALQGFAVIVRLTMIALETVRGLAPLLAASHPRTTGVAAFGLTALLLVAGGSMLVCVAAGTVVRRQVRSRSGGS